MEANGAKETTPKWVKKDYAFLDLLQAPVFVVDADKKVLYANQGFADDRAFDRFPDQSGGKWGG
jgi:nitrogen-specific signal transduction histidine kinase